MSLNRNHSLSKPTMSLPIRLSISVRVSRYHALGIVDGPMGILSRKIAMPAQLASNPIHYKEVLVSKNAAQDPKK